MGACAHWNLKDPTISKKIFKCAFQIHINISQYTLRGISVSFFRNSSSNIFSGRWGARKRVAQLCWCFIMFNFIWSRVDYMSTLDSNIGLIRYCSHWHLINHVRLTFNSCSWKQNHIKIFIYLFVSKYWLLALVYSMLYWNFLVSTLRVYSGLLFWFLIFSFVSVTRVWVPLSLLDLLRVIHSNGRVIVGFLYLWTPLEFSCGTNEFGPEFRALTTTFPDWWPLVLPPLSIFSFLLLFIIIFQCCMLKFLCSALEIFQGWT
jgi:hypothetical protein